MHMLSCGGFDQWLVRCCLSVIMSSPNFLILFSSILNCNSSMRRRLFFLLYSNKNCIILSSEDFSRFSRIKSVFVQRICSHGTITLFCFSFFSFVICEGPKQFQTFIYPLYNLFNL